MAGLGIVRQTKSEVNAETLVGMFPAKRTTITEETARLVNEANLDPLFNGDEFLSQMQTYQSVMQKNSASIKEYINALKFCAYLEVCDDNYTEAYKKARATDQFVIDRMDAPTGSSAYKELTFAASRFRKNNLVVDILTQADVPLYLMFQGHRFQAVQVLANEMNTAMYSKDRISAADKLLTHVKPPENVQVELDIGTNATTIIDRYESMINGLVDTQMEQAEAGGDLKAITNVAIIAKTEDEELMEAEID